MTQPHLSSSAADPHAAAAQRRQAGLVGLAVLAVLVVVGLAWAEWLPYADEVGALADARTWSAPALFDSAGGLGLGAGWAFTTAYFAAVWKALLVALLVAAAIEVLAPGRALLRWSAGGSGRRQGVVGAVASVPAMMCTCCAAPITVGLRRRGASVVASLAFWLGNPLLNPAVLAFLALVLPWPYAAVRGGVGVAVVAAVVVLVSRRSTGRGAATVDAEDPPARRELPGRYVRSLTRLAAVMVPEYVLVVLAVGCVSAAGSDLDGWVQRAGLVAVPVVVVVALVFVVPTGGEIPVVAALVAADASGALTGVVLIALPALSLPSALMVGRALGWRVTATAAGVVAAGSLLAGAGIVALT